MLVGRGPLLEELAAMIAAGRPLALCGEAGAGKSSVLDELAARTGRTALVGGGLPTLRWMSLLAFRRALRRHLPEGDTAALAAYVAGRVGEGILVLDDLQWVDRETLVLVSAVAARRTRVLLAFREPDPDARRVRDSLTSWTCPIVDIGPLDPVAAAEVVRRHDPALSPDRVLRILELAGGNPLLVQQLAAPGATSLNHLISQRLGSLPPQGREALAMLSLLGRPVPAGVLGSALPLLTDAGLVALEDGTVRLRHGLFADRAVDQLDPAVRRGLHARLARLVVEPGEAARHHAAAGERDHARQKALLAAALAGARPAERGRHLGLAAACAPEGEADGLRLAAAAAMAQAGDLAAAERLALSVAGTDAATRAAALIHVARARIEAGDGAAAWTAVTEGLRIGGGADPVIALGLRIEGLRARTLHLHEPSTGLLEEADSVREQARIVGAHQARAALAVGQAELTVRAPGWSTALAEALAAARAESADDVECAAAHALIVGHMVIGNPAAALQLATDMVDRAGRRLLWGWRQQFLASRLWLDLHHRGAYLEVIPACRAALADPSMGDGAAALLQALLALALADTGELTAAQAVLGAGASAVPGILAWTAAEVAWLAGDPAAAVAICATLGHAPHPVPALAAVTAAWARRDLADGDAPDPSAVDLSYGGSALELAAVADLDVEPATAVAGFDAAGPRWLGWQRRAVLRCGWAGADAARLAGAADSTQRLHEVLGKVIAVLGETAPLRERTRRSLWDLGVRLPTHRSADERGLTQRERDVLSLVAEGLTTAAIARRLQVTASTVDAHIGAAVDKLGARSRTEAAARLLAGG